ncbi:hypothetical protein [Pseudoalteromonas phenolica]|uniref:Uncharacterized protein n=1 Tax=Pseudoalteromonas phenolica TaxID=161398 RepID=A0A0S2K694_9GAMM|nr:hypothetical protein [Pseudoalteromonas phenolica]ALO43991.1 hypothetical protein PP2015_3517 [Pseudoalteromonas phenolica]MBE0356965.1 hypothetical protein [Pseudoalteromonas phenolica O-BC30]
MEALSEYLNYFTYAPLPIFLFALVRCWKNIGARWLLILLVTIECIDLYSYQYTIKWTTHYYGWVMFMNSLFLLPSLYRNSLATYLHNITNLKFFERAKTLEFSQQEAALIILFLISMLANLISYSEVFLYKSFVIDDMYFKSYILGKLQLVLHIFSCLAALSLSTNNKGYNYETAES